MGLTQAVRVWARSRSGVDPMGEPTYSWSHFDVHGALVRPISAEERGSGDAASDLRPDKVSVAFSVALPKGYAGPPLRGARVTLLERRYGMDTGDEGWRTALEVSGEPHPVIPCPTRWDTIVEVGRREG